MTSAAFAPIVDDNGELRLLEERDLPLTLSWRNHSDSRRWFHSAEIISDQQHRAWFQRYLERSDDYVFIFVNDELPVGQAAIYDIADGVATFGRVLVDPEQRRRGISHRLVAACLAAADTRLSIERLHLDVMLDNAAAIRVYEAAGFRIDESREAPQGSIAMSRERP